MYASCYILLQAWLTDIGQKVCSSMMLVSLSNLILFSTSRIVHPLTRSSLELLFHAWWAKKYLVNTTDLQAGWGYAGKLSVPHTYQVDVSSS